MHAVYMQSVKDHVGPSSGRYKLAYGLNANVNVFSQAPGPEYHQSYEMDTFCVPNDFVEYENSGDDENGDEIGDEIGDEGSTSTGNRKKRRKIRRRKSNQLVKRRRLVEESDSD